MFNVSIAAFLQKHHRFGASVQFLHHFAQTQIAFVRVSPHDGHDLFAKLLFVQFGHKITEQRVRPYPRQIAERSTSGWMY